MKAEPDVLLYNVPPSFYSQIARLALAEKGVTWRTELIAAGPPIFESYEPWYMKLNAGGTVPTMVHDGEVVPHSFLIADYAERVFDGPRLIPDDPRDRAEMERWIGALRRISIREISYASDKIKGIGARVNRMRIRRLQANAIKHPDMADIYRAKEVDIRVFAGNTADPNHMARTRAHVAAVLDEMESVLADRPWLAGETYSLADVVWTVGVARLIPMGGADPLDGRPALARWYATVKQRPSFDGADVWDHAKPGKIIAMLATKLWRQLIVILVALTALCAAIWWLL